MTLGTPLAHALTMPVPKGRIILNIHQTGVISDETFTVLEGRDAVIDYMKKYAKRAEDAGESPYLMIRSSADTKFKHVNVVIQYAKDLQIYDVRFAVYMRKLENTK